MTVRPATRVDEPSLYSLLVDLHKHNNYGWGTPFDPATVLARIERGTRPVEVLPDGTVRSSRTNPSDLWAGSIGVIGPEGGRLVGSVGLFIEPSAWFAKEAVSLFELWLFVRPEERDRRQHEKALFAYAEHIHEQIKAELKKAGYPFEFPLQTGFMHAGKRFPAMARLWRRLCRGEPVGMLFWKS